MLVFAFFCDTSKASENLTIILNKVLFCRVFVLLLQLSDRSVIHTKTWWGSRTTNARSSHNLYLCVILSSGCVYIVAWTVGDSH